MYDVMQDISYGDEDVARKKAMTVRVVEQRVRRLMRARRAKTQSDLINTLLAEEEERLRSHRTLRATAGTARSRELDDRLL
jgi:hypothetical protein